MTQHIHAAGLLRKRILSAAETALRVLLVGYAWGMIVAVMIVVVGPLALVGLVLETVRGRA